MKNNGNELIPSRESLNVSFKHKGDKSPFLCPEVDLSVGYIAQMVMNTRSMEPTIEMDAIIFIDTRVKTFVDEGIYAVNYGGILSIRRIAVAFGTNNFRVSCDQEVIRSVELAEAHELNIEGKVIYSLTGRKIF